MNPDQLTPDQRQRINAFVAEKCGWENIHDFNGFTRRHVHDLFASLDHCHEATRALTDSQRAEFRKTLSTIWMWKYNLRTGIFPRHDDSVNATAPQRALALFETLGGQL